MNETSRRALTIPLILSLALIWTPVLQAQQNAPPEQGPQTASIQGRVFGPDRVTPVPGAVVRAVRGHGVQIYSSLPTDEKGSFSLGHLALGSYDVLVELSDGVYLVERTFNVTEAKSYPLSLATVPSEGVDRKVTAVDKPVKGYAWTLEGKREKVGGFWRTPGGIAVIAGGVVGAALALSGGNDHKGSNSTP